VKRGEEQAKIQRLLQRLPDLSTLLRGSLLHRTIRHARGCRKCAAGGGHSVWVLATGYPGRKIRQRTLRREQVSLVRRRLANYRKVQKALEQICELNRQQLHSTASHSQEHD